MRLNFIFLLATLFFSCGSNRNMTTINQLLLSYESGSCYGKCEVFKFKINENKTIEYEGLKNVEKIGNYRAEISVDDFNEIKKLIYKVDLKSIDSVYTSNSTDLHLRILNLNNTKQNKRILLFDNVPSQLNQIENKVYFIVEKYKYKFSKN
jgi:tetrahydromethanopterin S-methyltransferase subunit G